MDHSRPYLHTYNPYAHQRYPSQEKRRPEDPWGPAGPWCSLVTILVLFLVVLGVLAVAGLALYMGALRLEPVQSFLVFDGSMRLIGEKFTAGLANKSGPLFYERSRRYQTILEAVYGKSLLGAALHEVFVSSFANGSLIVFFRLILDRRKIPKPVSSIEETLKDIILEEASSPLSVLNSLKLDSKELHIKRFLEERPPPDLKHHILKSEAAIPKTELKRHHHIEAKKPKESVSEAPQNEENESILTNIKHSPALRQYLDKKPAPTMEPPERTMPPPPERGEEEEESQEEWRPLGPVGGRGFEGEAEVVETEAGGGDVVTLLPVRSHVGVRAGLRPKPPAPRTPVLRPSSEDPRLPLQAYFTESYQTMDRLSQVQVVTRPTDSRSPQGQGRRSDSRREPKSVGFPASLNFTVRLEDQMRLLIEEIFSNITTPRTHTTQSAGNISRHLDKIAKVKVSEKALSSGHHSNAPFRLLTKVFNKAPVRTTPLNNTSTTTTPTPFVTDGCGEEAMQCASGECVPLRLRCNRLADCRDASDEKDCSCAQLLRSGSGSSKLCDGVHDCWDFSDEEGCDWCKEPGQYMCSNAKTCIPQSQVCDGFKHCPRGDDEANCLSLNPTSSKYNSEGYLMVRKEGEWGKLCLQNFENLISKSKSDWSLEQFGRSVCSTLTFRNFVSISRETDKEAHGLDYFELSPTSIANGTDREKFSFEKSTCIGKEVAKVTCAELECGIRPQASIPWSSERRSRIVGGGNAWPGSWPWQAALYKEGEFQCGGTLISDMWIISAAHCFYRAEMEYWVARLGSVRRGGPPSPSEQTRRVASILLHPSYQEAGFLHDIALLRLASPLAPGPHLRHICLPPSASSGPVGGQGSLCTVVGWGQLHEAGRLFPDTLQEVEVPIISTAECRRRTGGLPLYRLTENMFCAGYERGGRDACLGDSGGPLMCQEKDGRWSLSGVTSNGYGCARANRPGVYTKVSAYVGWIRGIVAGEEDSGASVPPACPGHRCPLGECLPKARICNGYTECSDSSDESICW